MKTTIASFLLIGVAIVSLSACVWEEPYHRGHGDDDRHEHRDHDHDHDRHDDDHHGRDN